MVEIRQIPGLIPMYHSKKLLRDLGQCIYSKALPNILFRYYDAIHPIRVVSQYFSLDFLRNKREVLW